jgi:hypothetical protein
LDAATTIETSVDGRHTRGGRSDISIASFRHGYLWNTLCSEDAALADRIAAQTECIVIRGTIPIRRTSITFAMSLGSSPSCSIAVAWRSMIPNVQVVAAG